MEVVNVLSSAKRGKKKKKPRAPFQSKNSTKPSNFSPRPAESRQQGHEDVRQISCPVFRGERFPG